MLGGAGAEPWAFILDGKWCSYRKETGYKERGRLTD